MRKIVFIGTIIALLAIGAVVYFMFFGGGVANTGSPSSGNSQAGSGDNAGSSQPVKISDHEIVSPVLSLTGDSVWYFDRKGGLYQNMLDGSKETEYSLNDKVPATKALWPPSGNDYIVQTGAAGKSMSYYYFDSANKSYVEAPSNVETLAWLSDGKRIVYVWRRADGGLELKTARPDTSNYVKITELDKFYSLYPSPDGQFVVLLEQYSSKEPNKAYVFDFTSLEQNTVLDRGRNLEVLISPDSKKMLFTRLNETSGAPEVWLYNFASAAYENLKISTTLDKAVWSADSTRFYYGLPKNASASAFLSGGATSDELFVYDTLVKNSVKIAGSFKNQADIRNPFLAEKGAAFFFKNGFDSKLYRLDLK